MLRTSLVGVFAEVSTVAVDEAAVNARHGLHTVKSAAARFEPSRHCFRQAADEVVVQQKPPQFLVYGGIAPPRAECLDQRVLPRRHQELLEAQWK